MSETVNYHCSRPFTLFRAVEYAREEMEIDAICLADSMLDASRGFSTKYHLENYRLSSAEHAAFRDLWMGR